MTTREKFLQYDGLIDQLLALYAETIIHASAIIMLAPFDLQKKGYAYTRNGIELRSEEALKELVDTILLLRHCEEFCNYSGIYLTISKGGSLTFNGVNDDSIIKHVWSFNATDLLDPKDLPEEQYFE